MCILIEFEIQFPLVSGHYPDLYVGGRFPFVTGDFAMDDSTGRVSPVQIYIRSIDLILAPITSRVSYKAKLISISILSTLFNYLHGR